jgi:pimeloyl-ACP methyl ester carboxylesterase
VAVTGGHLAYRRTGGGGVPVVLSHGLTDNGLCWARLVRALEPEFDMVMLDARGHGASSRLTPNEIHDPGRDIAEAIEGLGLARPMVVGHSVGAIATAAFAAAYPGQAARVVLEDPPLLPAPDAAAAEARRRRFGEQVRRFRSMTVAEIIASGKASSPNWHEDDLPAWAEAKQQVDPEAWPTYARPWQALIAGIAAPTLLIHGEQALGSLVTPAAAMEAAGLNPNLQAMEIAHAGHNVRRENFADYLSAVLQFLRAQ